MGLWSARRPSKELAPNEALAQAADAGDLAGVLRALERGASPDSPNSMFDSPNSMFDSPAGLAAHKGHLGCLQALLSAGANADGELDPWERSTLLSILIELPYDEAEREEDGNDPGSPIGRDCALALARAGAHPNLPDTLNGLTPLSKAAADGRGELVAALLAHGADPDFIEESAPNARTALMEAAMKGRLDCVHLLLAAGTDPTATDSRGRDASDWAREGIGVGIWSHRNEELAACLALLDGAKRSALERAELAKADAGDAPCPPTQTTPADSAPARPARPRL